MDVWEMRLKTMSFYIASICGCFVSENKPICCSLVFKGDIWRSDARQQR
jgi:hypothetical protein